MASCSVDQMRFRLEKMAWVIERRSGFSVAIYYIEISLIVVGLLCCAFVVLFLVDQVRVKCP